MYTVVGYILHWRLFRNVGPNITNVGLFGGEIFMDLAVFEHNHENELCFFTSKKYNYENKFTPNFSKSYDFYKITK